MREYRADPEEWKRSHQYGRRSLAETVFGMTKLRYGGSLSSRGGDGAARRAVDQGGLTQHQTPQLLAVCGVATFSTGPLTLASH